VRGAGRPRVHSPRPLAATSSLSVGWGLVVIVVFGAHLTTSARFRVRAPGPVSGRLYETAAWKGATSLSRFPAAFPPPALASWSSCSRSGIRPSSRLAYRPAHWPDPDGVSTFRTHKQRPGWVPSISRGRRCSSGLATITSPRLPLLNGTSLHPATTTIDARLRLTRHQRGFKQFTRPVFPSPDAPGWNGSFLGFPPSSAPRNYSQRTSGQGQAYRARTRNTLYGISQTSDLAGLLDTCDLVSHSWFRQSRFKGAQTRAR
jgi:hypothetical protein